MLWQNCICWHYRRLIYTGISLGVQDSRSQLLHTHTHTHTHTRRSTCSSAQRFRSPASKSHLERLNCLCVCICASLSLSLSSLALSLSLTLSAPVFLSFLLCLQVQSGHPNMWRIRVFLEILSPVLWRTGRRTILVSASVRVYVYGPVGLLWNVLFYVNIWICSFTYFYLWVRFSYIVGTRYPHKDSKEKTRHNLRFINK